MRARSSRRRAFSSDKCVKADICMPDLLSFPNRGRQTSSRRETAAARVLMHDARTRRPRRRQSPAADRVQPPRQRREVHPGGEDDRDHGRRRRRACRPDGGRRRHRNRSGVQAAPVSAIPPGGRRERPPPRWRRAGVGDCFQSRPAASGRDTRGERWTGDRSDVRGPSSTIEGDGRGEFTRGPRRGTIRFASAARRHPRCGRG